MRTSPQTLPSAPQVGAETPHHSSALVSRKWYVDGMHGSDKNDCKSRQYACKTIGHAVALTFRGDSISVAPATYPENLTINHSLEIAGSGAATTIIDGRGLASEIISPTPGEVVTVSKMTMRNGGGPGQGDGGAIYNCSATLAIIDSIISENTASHGMGALGYGGGIYNCPGSTLTIVKARLLGIGQKQAAPSIMGSYSGRRGR